MSRKLWWNEVKRVTRLEFIVLLSQNQPDVICHSAFGIHHLNLLALTQLSTFSEFPLFSQRVRGWAERCAHKAYIDTDIEINRFIEMLLPLLLRHCCCCCCIKRGPMCQFRFKIKSAKLKMAVIRRDICLQFIKWTFMCYCHGCLWARGSNGCFSETVYGCVRVCVLCVCALHSNPFMSMWSNVNSTYMNISC